MVHYPNTFDPVIYDFRGTSGNPQVTCVPIHRMSGFPFQLKGSCCFNFLFSPNFERFLDFDYEVSQIVIRKTKDEQVIQRIPSQLMNLNMLGHLKSIKSIATIGSRIMFKS